MEKIVQRYNKQNQTFIQNSKNNNLIYSINNFTNPGLNNTFHNFINYLRKHINERPFSFKKLENELQISQSQIIDFFEYLRDAFSLFDDIQKNAFNSFLGMENESDFVNNIEDYQGKNKKICNILNNKSNKNISEKIVNANKSEDITKDHASNSYKEQIDIKIKFLGKLNDFYVLSKHTNIVQIPSLFGELYKTYPFFFRFKDSWVLSENGEKLADEYLRYKMLHIIPEQIILDEKVFNIIR